MRVTYCLMALCAVGLLVAAVQPAWAWNNNGFETDYVYVTRETGAVGAGIGFLDMRRESDGVGMGNFLPADTNWLTLTFAGKGQNDARMFVAKLTGGDPGTDILIEEYNGNAQMVNSRSLSTIPGVQLGAGLRLGNIRYNRMHNTLFVAANPETTLMQVPAKAWEIDLGLTTLMHTYVGDTLPNTVDGLVLGEARQVNVDFNEDNGALLMISRHLGRPLADGKGDLISFNTVGRAVGGTTNVYKTLIDGGIYSGGDGTYNTPNNVMYRGTVGPSGRPTILIPTMPDANARPVIEFYLDQIDNMAPPDGNLVKRGAPLTAKRGWNGQLDEVTGQVWFGAIRGGIRGLWADDTNTNWTASNWMDADSPAPEPITLALLGLGFVMLRRRRA